MKKSLPQIALAFLLLLSLLGRAQQFSISGLVVDANTKVPIPFASIGLRAAGTGALTNESGYFQLPGSDKFKTDSLVFMTLGYNRHAVLVEPGKAENLCIGLSPRPAGLITDCPVGPCKTARKSSPPAKDEIIAGLPGTQYAFFIMNDKRRQHRKMRSVSFYIGENGLPMEPFRIRIYKADGANHSPNTDLLNERVFLTATRAGEWYTIDLTRYNIATPKEGYYVALEFGKSANALSQPALENYTPSGQLMRPTFEFNKSITWRYS